MKTILRRYPLTILLATAIWVVCLIPVPETPLNEISFIDKWTHFVMYAVLTLVLLYEHRKALRQTNHTVLTARKADGISNAASLTVRTADSVSNAAGPAARKAAAPAGHKKSNSGSVWLLLLPISQGCLVELAQAYLTTCRSGDWFDALCNTLGVLIGAGIAKLRVES
ncbi:MAG: VanZ family protein [Prevotella sp.]|nr:VanZ family protein [Prevotella sp.]